MKKLLLLLLLPLAAPAAAEQMELDDVVAANIEARGGYENWKAIDSAYMTGTMLMGPGVEAPFRIWFKRPDRVRMEFDVQGMTGVQAYDGETGWYVMPFMGKTEPEVMAEDQLKDIKETADFDGDLIDWKAKGHQVELLGKEEVEGTEAYKLKVTKASGDETILYLDSEYMLEIKQSMTTDRQGTEMTVHTAIGDYKEVGDVILPHSMEMTFEGMPLTQAMTLSSVELNVDIDDDKFEMPAAAAAAAEAPAED